jgi:DNA recombination protein RmuC
MESSTWPVSIGMAIIAVAAMFAVMRWRMSELARTGRSCLDKAQSELSEARLAKSEIELHFAVEREKSSRIPELERNLCEKEFLVSSGMATHAALEAKLSASSEGMKRVEMALGEQRERLIASEQACRELKENQISLEKSISEKAALLSERTEATQMLADANSEKTRQLKQSQNEASELAMQVAKLSETLTQERKQGSEKLALLLEAKEGMTKEFKTLADDLMKQHGETFSKSNKEQIDTVLSPLKDKLNEFQQGLQLAQAESTKERATLAEQIRQLSESSARMSSETTNLTRALKGSSRTQGAWGEMVLSSILERSGLREGSEYVVQQSHTNEDGGRLRPDVIVQLPGDQRIVIDSKVSLQAFEIYVNAESDIEREGSLLAHANSMRSHIRMLSSKEYHSAAGSHLDYVVMFVPIVAGSHEVVRSLC